MSLFFPQQRASGSADTAVRRWRRKTPYLRARRMAACGGRECRRLAAETKGGKGTIWFPCPLLTPPNPPLRRDSLRSRGETGVRGLGSGRRADFGTLLDPEFSLRKAPRITVRGQTVQGGGVPLRKAPLPSSIDPWSTKRPCGPLAFRRATEGSRVLRKGRGVKRGRETLVSLPLLPPPPGGGFPGPPKAAIAHALRGRQVASTGCAAVSAQGPPSADGKKTARPPERRQGSPLPRGKSFLFSLLTGLCYCIIIIVQHNKKGLRLCSGSFVGIARSTSRSWKS